MEHSTDGSKWTMLNASISPLALSYEDTATPSESFYYRLTGKTSPSNLDIPYNVVSLSVPGTDPGICLLQRHFGGKNNATANGAVVRKMAVDSSGNVILCGIHQYTCNYGDGDRIGAGGQDAFVAKYSPSGQTLWSARWGGVSSDQARGIAVDSQNNIIITGVLSTGLEAGTGDFGWGPIAFNGGGEVFVIKLNPSGGLIWQKIFGGSGSDGGIGVAIDSGDNIYLTGEYGFFGTAPDFGGGALPGYAGNQINTYVVKLNSAGVHQWSKGWGGSGGAIAVAIGVGASGVYVGGHFKNTCDFGTGNISTPNNFLDIFVAKYSLATGEAVWVKQIGDPVAATNKNDQRLRAMVVDSSDNVILAGDFGSGSAGIDFGDGFIFYDIQPSGSVGSVFVAKINSSGTTQWVKHLLGDNAPLIIHGVAVDSALNVYACGEAPFSYDFGGGFHIFPGGPLAFLFKVSPSNVFQWSRVATIPPFEQLVCRLTAIATSAAGQIFAGGDCGFNQNPVFGAKMKITTLGTWNNGFWTKWSP